MKIDKRWLICLLIFFAFIVRFIPLDFPSFTSDEARVAYRAYTLSKTGKDELGRSFPLLFNSLDDYQLPVVSYVTASGVLIFGKTDLGVRIPFILIGMAIVFLIYKLSRFFVDDEHYGFYAALIACFSPGLIFFSKFPNEYILATFLILILITQMLKEKVSIFKIFLIISFMLLTSKALWFILLPVLLLTLLLNEKIKKREKINLFAVGLIPTVIIICLYLNIPQGTRSLIENTFPIISDVTIKNGVEKLRSQGVFGWPAFFDRILFNKAYFVVTGIFHWFSEFSLSKIFAELDPNGNFGFLKLGAFSKIVIIPFLVGLIVLIKSKKQLKFLAFYILLVTFPLALLYPVEKIGFILLALPFIALISALGFKFFNRKITVVFFILLVSEFVVNLWFIQASIKNSNKYRQGWIKKVILEAYAFSPNYNIAFSDNITEDIVPFIEWHTEFNPKDAYQDIKFPYRFRQTKIANYKIIGSEDTFYNCSLDKPTYIFASERDLSKIQKNIKVLPEKSYKDFLGNDVIYLLPPKVCVH